MRSAFKMFGVLLGVFAAVFSLSAKELNIYVSELDRVERNFWSAAFARSNSSIRKTYKESLLTLERCANDVNNFRRKNGSKAKYGDLKAPAMLVNSLLISHSAFKRNFRYPRLMSTSFFEVRKELASKGLSRASNESDVSEADFMTAINSIRDKNIDELSEVFSRMRLRPYEQEVLLRTANTFYEIIINARLTVFKLRKNDPIFQQRSSAVRGMSSRYGNKRR